ncbi:conserved hypothetical protein [uncultured Desulfobacterium sp.]|uniref:Transporter n=1 Tax=uncultured Desulfobacterium sp. TaxID=201089 RepID=A0A445MXQ4_9BACT|nr:conserved hypothetical protein [uncultured Desulfobacterium sp.]
MKYRQKRFLQISRHLLSFPLIILSIISYAHGGETEHFMSGVAGIKAASLPPPGFYYRLYNIFYNADRLIDEKGDDSNLDFDLEVYAMAHRFLWISETKILGANYFANIIVPFVDTDIQIKDYGIDTSKFGLGDIFIEPFCLAWHSKRFDSAFALAVMAPTGKYDKSDPASPGKDIWTGLITLGGTLYLDAGKAWAASILTRYEIHSEKDHTDIRPGEDFHFEWGISKTILKGLDIGLTGYCQWQVSDDRGSDVNWDKNVHDRIFSAGPEIEVILPVWKLSFSLRSQREFKATDRAEGNITVFTLTKMF